MGYKLIIVESPAKAKTLQGFLTSNYIVTASKGHVRDLPKFRLGIRILNDNVEVDYEITADHKEIVKFIVKTAKNAEEIYLATDEDREGEAIAYHIASLIGRDPESLPRIVFHEITKTAILHALETPRRLDMNMVNSQQARRLLDRIVGFKLSGLLANRIGAGMSAGRVQSSTLSLVVDKEREIMNFTPIKFEVIKGLFDKVATGNLTHLEGKRLHEHAFQNPEETKAMIDKLSKLNYYVESIESTKRKSKPNPPFTTSTLQQVASNKLGYSPDRTMRIAQRLYEGVETDRGKSGVITYMRTDSLNIAKEAQAACREFIKKNFGMEYLCPDVRSFTTSSKGAQEAHEAIRPTNLAFTPDIAQGYLEDEQLALYKLIYNRFLATQSTEAVFESMKMVIQDDSGYARFEINGSKVLFDGFQKFTGIDSKERLLPNFNLKHRFSSVEISSESKETLPPPRYTEASLVKKMEEVGIGRPSTYASTIALLNKRGYVSKEGKSLKATDRAFKVIDALRQYFPNIVDIGFTANLEKELDDIAEAKDKWDGFLIRFDKEFEATLENAKATMEKTKVAIKTGEKCPNCGADMVTREGRFGKFDSCSAYPKCKYIKPKAFDNSNKEYVEGISCPVCKGRLEVRKGKFGNYYVCEHRDEKKCDFINRSLPLEGQSCPKCNGYLVLRFGKPNCPKCNPPKPFVKNTKSLKSKK